MLTLTLCDVGKIVFRENEIQRSIIVTQQLDDKLNASFKQANKLDDGFKQVSDKIDAVVQNIDFMQVTKQGDANKIDAKVACKPLLHQNEIKLAILGESGLSPQILKFYGTKRFECKLNFEYASQVDDNSENLLSLVTHIARWMTPELIKQQISSNGNFKPVYTFNCEMFS
ncbi:hypothetical protein F8M41_004608 [Gigaspora margarita]|uniref:Uncharacterized protein n=1 Tax=Gigaspora margarita TaxID=4874 RepID=A0A8H4ES18_GIGMA|nr:hypothetical protein F8M41_004608 [Gigaspora margarita]